MWKIKFEPLAAKHLKRLDKPAKQRIEKFIDTLIINENPREKGKALQGDLKGLWRYRVGDYRLMAEIRDNELVILFIEIGHRKEVYKL